MPFFLCRKSLNRRLKALKAALDKSPAGMGSRTSRWLWYPRAMRVAPKLDERRETQAPTPRYALLINPFYRKDPNGSFGKHVLTPSQALTALAGATPPEWTVRVWDENLLQGPPPCEPFPQVVGITVHLTFARRAYRLSRWYRRRGAMVVLGGPHVIGCPEEAAAHCDAICVGEGTQAWPEILRNAEHGNLKARYEGDYRKPYCEAPPVRREALDRRDFLTAASLIASRGCRNRCDFCYLSTRGLEMPYQRKDAAQVAQEFAATGEPYAVFTDNNLSTDPEYLRALCRALRPLDKIWSAAVTLDVAGDPELVREMALAGCTGVFVGFESLTEENLRDAHKRGANPEDYARLVKVFHDQSIQVNGSFVFGFDHDRPDIFERTARWIEDNRLECATFHILTPYPGTPLFRRMEAEGRLLHRNWELYDTGHAVFLPRHLTPAQLEEGYAWCYRRIFSLRSIWRRRPAAAVAIPGYLAMSLLYKKMNFLWPTLIRLRLTRAVWRPLVECARRRHVRWRQRAFRDSASAGICLPVAPGV
ncbi:MAG: radical SAM protein [Candidatus Sumerlaeota bacterium]|nr:radical SAM protein [Candidatus Sumerlaeota bacterium]